MLSSKNLRRAFSLLEIMLATVIVAVLSVAVMRFAIQPGDRVKERACQLTSAELQVHIQQFQADTQQLPSRDLRELAGDNYVGHAIGTCPLDARPYVLDRKTGQLLPHSH